MKYLILIIVFLSTRSNAQINLVPNPGFEDTLACPANLSGQYGDEIYKLTHWFPAANSPDYFNSCAPVNMSTGQASIPYNGCGFQNANSGNGYIGLFTAVNSQIFFNYREFIGVALTQPLTQGTTYYFRMKVSCGWGSWQNIGVFSNKIGIRLSSVFYEAQINPLLPDNFCTAYSDSILTDTTNWTEISFQFIADSNYTYLYLGNFFDAQHTDTILFFGQGAYYYIEDVCLSDDSTCSVSSNINSPISDLTSPLIFPNPLFSVLRIKCDLKSNFAIYNSTGQVAFKSTTFIGMNEYDLSFLPSGFYLLKFERELSEVFKIIKI